MRTAPVTPVVPARILGVQALQRSRKPGIGDPHQRVVMVAQQDVGEQGELEPLADRGQAREEVFSVGVAYEQVTGVAAVSGKVVDPCVEVPKATGHPPEARPLRPPQGPCDQFRHTFGTVQSPSALDKNQCRTPVFALPAALGLTPSPTGVRT